MSKEFWARWEYGLWRSDPAVAMLTPLSRGLWFEAINWMMQRSTFKISGTPEQLASACRCSVDSVHTLVKELQATEAAEVHQQNSSITLVCKKRQREAEISGKRSIAGSLGGSKTSETIGQVYNSISYFNFWKYYPRRTGKADAAKAWLQVDGESHIAEILAALEWQRRTPDWKKDNGKFIPFPATYLRGRRWEDEPPELRRDNGDPNI